MEARAEALQGSTSTTVNNMCLSLTWLDSLTIGGCELAPLCTPPQARSLARHIYWIDKPLELYL